HFCATISHRRAISPQRAADMQRLELGRVRRHAGVRRQSRTRSRPCQFARKRTLADGKLLSTWADQSVAAGSDIFLSLRVAMWSGRMSIVLQNAVARPAL